jgi:hypothetical protein
MEEGEYGHRLVIAIAIIAFCHLGLRVSEAMRVATSTGKIHILVGAGRVLSYLRV